MIIKFNKEYLEVCVDFIYAVNIGNNTVRYFPKDEEGIRQRLEKFCDSENVDLVVYFDDEVNVIGFMELLVDREQEYLQIIAIFNGGEIEDIMSAFFEYIKGEYPHFKQNYVLDKQNTQHTYYMNTYTDAFTSGYEKMFMIEKKDFNPKHHELVKKMEECHYPEFIEYHNHIYEDAFWNAENILEFEDHFHKFVAYHENEMIGYSIISNFGRDEEEVYFLHEFASDLDLLGGLISKALEEAFKTVDKVVMMLDPNEFFIKNFYKEIGFKERETIITYVMDDM